MRPSFPLVLPVTESRRWPEEGKVCTNSPEALDHVRLKLSSTLMSPSSYTTLNARSTAVHITAKSSMSSCPAPPNPRLSSRPNSMPASMRMCQDR